MQFSKRVSELARTHGVEALDVIFAVLVSSGIVSTIEAFAAIYRPKASTNAALSSRASNYIGQRPGLRRLIQDLDSQRTDNADTGTAKRRGRPRKDDTEPDKEDKPLLDYTDKDALLQEYARIAERCEKESDRLSALNAIANLQRMKQEAAVEDQKRTTYYIPYTYNKAEQLRQLLVRYFAEKGMPEGIPFNSGLPPSALLQ